MRRSLTVLLLLLLVALSRASDVRLVFEDASERIVFGADALPEAAPTDALRTTRREVSVAENGKNAVVIEPGRNLAYVLPWARLRTAPKIGRGNATHAYRVAVEVDPRSAGGHAIQVDLKDADGRKTANVGASQGYRAEFAFVRLGRVDVTATDDGVSPPVAMNTPAQLDAATLTNPAVLKTGLPRLVSPPAGGGAGEARVVGGTADGGRATGGGVLGNVLSTLLGLALVGGLAYAAWRYAQRNPDAVKAGLQRIGAEVPGPLEPETPPAVTPATPVPAGPSGPILLDPVAPISVTPISVAPVGAGQAATGVPRLVSAEGSALELPEGETVVGREALGGLMVAHDTVSRRHARIVRAGGGVTVEDLGSTNGTWINGAPAPGALLGGETVRFGAVEYRYEA